MKRSTVAARFLVALVPAVREAWGEATGRVCSRRCSEAHTYDPRCIMVTRAGGR